MAEFRKNKKISNFLYSKPVLVILTGIIVLFAINIAGIAKKSIETGKNKDSAQAKVLDLEGKEQHLSAAIEKLDTKEGAEDAIREKFRVVKEGEGLVVILDAPQSSDVQEKPPETGFWSFLKSIFK